ncbi:hypothetical protein SALBM135S_10153 [Streptomyces alboniger]
MHTYFLKGCVMTAGTSKDAVKTALSTQALETPSWAYGNSGTRFKVFAQPGVPRTTREKLDDAARVHAHTGIAPTVALHIVDRVDDYGALAAYAEERGLRLGAINSNVFQDDDYRLDRSPTPTRPSAARRSDTSWSASTSWTRPDRRTSSSRCVDTGHHAPGTNIEFIVATLLREGRLGGFDFNSRFYAHHVRGGPRRRARGGRTRAPGVAFMLDQCHNIEAKIPAIIRSVMNVQEATAKALLVDAEALAEAQRTGDVLAANGALMDAFSTDVRPLLAEVREEVGARP